MTITSSLALGESVLGEGSGAVRVSGRPGRTITARQFLVLAEVVCDSRPIAVTEDQIGEGIRRRGPGFASQPRHPSQTAAATGKNLDAC